MSLLNIFPLKILKVVAVAKRITFEIPLVIPLSRIVRIGIVHLGHHTVARELPNFSILNVLIDFFRNLSSNISLLRRVNKYDRCVLGAGVVALSVFGSWIMKSVEKLN